MRVGQFSVGDAAPVVAHVKHKAAGLLLKGDMDDRRLGMASLLLDTAGASPFGAPLHLRQLPVEVARTLSARLVAQLSRRPL